MQSCVLMIAQEYVAIMSFKNVGFVSKNQKYKLQSSVVKLSRDCCRCSLLNANAHRTVWSM